MLQRIFWLITVIVIGCYGARDAASEDEQRARFLASLPKAHELRPKFRQYLSELNVDNCVAGTMAEAISEHALLSSYVMALEGEWPRSLCHSMVSVKVPATVMQFQEVYFFYVYDFGAVIGRDSTGCTTIWSDSTLVEVSYPVLDTFELTGVAPSELVLRGFGGMSINWGGEVVSFDGDMIRLITPETKSSAGIRRSALRGSSWEYEDPEHDGVMVMRIFENQSGNERGQKRARQSGIVRFDAMAQKLQITFSDSTLEQK